MTSICAAQRFMADRAPGVATAPAMIGRWLARRRRRRALAEIAVLGERTMLDLGFNPDDVRAEAAKPFWRP